MTPMRGRDDDRMMMRMRVVRCLTANRLVVMSDRRGMSLTMIAATDVIGRMRRRGMLRVMINQ